MDIKSFVDSLFKASEEEEKKTLKVTAQADKKSQKVELATPKREDLSVYREIRGYK